MQLVSNAMRMVYVGGCTVFFTFGKEKFMRYFPPRLSSLLMLSLSVLWEIHFECSSKDLLKTDLLY